MQKPKPTPDRLTHRQFTITDADLVVDAAKPFLPLPLALLPPLHHLGDTHPTFFLLTSLAVIPSVTLGRAKMQKTVTSSLTQSTDAETDGHGGVITVALQYGESVVKLTIHGSVSISHTPCLPCHLDLTDTISCSNRCMLTLYCLITHSIVISRR